jgi:hypothetical protein
MLNGTTVVRAPARHTTAEWLGAPARNLLQFLAVVCFLCAVACLYFSEANTIAGIRNDTLRLNAQAAALERENSALMVQVAAWNRPAYIQSKADALNLIPAAKPTYVQVPSPQAPVQAVPEPRSADPATWWQSLVNEISARWLPAAMGPNFGMQQ